MANRVLTVTEKAALAADPNYKANLEDKILSYSNYWSSHDGGGLANTLAARTKWAKDRTIGVQILTYGIQDAEVVAKTFRVSQALQIDLGAADQPTETIIAAMLSQGKFDELSSLYFGLLGESIDFTFGGA